MVIKERSQGVALPLSYTGMYNFILLNKNKTFKLFWSYWLFKETASN